MTTALEPALARVLSSRFAQRQVDCGAAAVTLRECGAPGLAPTFVLLHGMYMDSASWLQLAIPLQRHGHVIAWDAPGYGGSSPLPELGDTSADYAQRLEALLERLEVRKCVLVGHGWGTLVANAYASGPGWRRTVGVVAISPYLGAEQARDTAHQSQDTYLALDAPSWVERTLCSEVGDDDRSWARWCAARVPLKGYGQALQMLRGSTLASQVNSRLEVLCGEHDEVTPPELCGRWAKCHGASFTQIWEAGHLSLIEQPEQTSQLILSASRRAMAGAVFA